MTATNSNDPLALLGIDHVELWVGNARQAAHFYRTGFGFTPVAYAGPETGVRDRASWVLEQGAVRFVLTTALRPDSEVAAHVASHGDGVRDVALAVPDAGLAYRTAVERGATGVAEPADDKDDHGVVRRAAIATYGDTVHSLLDRSAYQGPFLPGYVAWNAAVERGVRHGQGDVAHPVAVPGDVGGDLGVGAQRGGEREPDGALLQHPGGPVPHARLRAGVGDRREPEPGPVEVGGLPGVTDPQLDVVDAEQRERVVRVGRGHAPPPRETPRLAQKCARAGSVPARNTTLPCGRRVR